MFALQLTTRFKYLDSLNWITYRKKCLLFFPARPIFQTFLHLKYFQSPFSLCCQMNFFSHHKLRPSVAHISRPCVTVTYPSRGEENLHKSPPFFFSYFTIGHQDGETAAAAIHLPCCCCCIIHEAFRQARQASKGNIRV